LVPFLVLKKLGKVSDLEFSNREERPLYFTIASIGYLLLFIASAFLKNIDIMHVTLAVFAVTCIFTIVNLYWKMSGHMTFSTIAFITLIYLFPSTKLLFLVFILTPIIAASRVILKKHTIMQVIAGVLTSVAICILIFWVL
jgi:membrane-associated phospholipid phosphatase